MTLHPDEPPDVALQQGMPAGAASRLGAGRVPFVDYGGSGKTLIFLHANGYPPACYAPLMGALAAHYHVLAMLLRPLWPRLVAPDIRSWSVFSDDLSELVQEQELVPVIAAGHSMGAVTALRAALRMPRLFEALVLLDPVLLPRRVIVAWWLARVAGLGLWLHPMTRRALKRRRHFDNLDQVFLSYRQREVFRNFTDEGLRVLIQGMMKSEAGSGYTLAYSPEWEARVYDTGVWSDWDLWNGLPRLRVPTLIVRGSDSDAFPIASAREVQNRNRRIQMRTVERASHLVPLEQPEAVFDLAREFLEAAEERVA